MNILFPIAGAGLRFKSEKEDIPKILIKIKNKTLLEYSISTLKIEGQYIFISLKYENDEYNKEIESIITRLQPNAIIILIDKITRGSAETCLAAEKYINNDDELILTNGDQYLNWNPNQLFDKLQQTKPDGCVSLYDHEDVKLNKPSKYSHVKLNQNGYAEQFCEKFAISKNSLNGIHYWKHGKYLIDSIKKIIEYDIKINGEYYISSTFNFLIKEGKRINSFKMEKNSYLSLGSPEEIQKNINYIN